MRYYGSDVYAAAQAIYNGEAFGVGTEGDGVLLLPEYVGSQLAWSEAKPPTQSEVLSLFPVPPAVQQLLRRLLSPPGT